MLGPMLNALTVCLLAVMAILGAELFHITKAARWPSPEASATNAMQAVFYETHGGPEVLHLGELAMPQMSEGMVKIQVKAAALNPIDFKLRRSDNMERAVAKPKIVGADVSGTVVETAGSTPFSVGDEVYGLLPLFSRWGGLAEYVAFDHRVFAKAPRNIPLGEAAALPMAGMVVLQNMAAAHTPRPGASILIQAGGGGVGVLAIQYAKHVLGYKHVIATGSIENARALYELGATRVIDYEKVDLRTCSDAEFAEAVGPVDVVLDPMSFAFEAKTLRSGVMKPGGLYIAITSSDWNATAEGSPSDFALGPLFMSVAKKYAGRLRALFDDSAVRYHHTMISPEGASLADLAMLVDEGKIKPVIHKTFALSEFREAFALQESGHAHGKILVSPGVPS